MIYNSTKTIYNLKLTTAKLINGKYRPELNTTLNEKFNVYPNYEMDTELYPVLNLLTLGYGGTDIIDNNLMRMKRSKHSPMDASLYNHVPFLIRYYGTPLTTEEKKIYRLKSKQIIHGVTYDCYYGLVLDDISYDDRIFKIKLTDGLSTMYPYDTNEDPTILNPEPSVNDNIDDLTEEFILNTCKVKIQISDTMLTEIKNNIRLIENSDDDFNITEIGLCSSLDTEIDGSKEAIWAQINYHVDVKLDLQLKNDGSQRDNLEYIIDIGGMEPLSLPQ